ncbi:transcriptional regulator [Weeksellaceae bacterium TAE3-ERU29]|nr:transcriptional regulator [Weeksellaceae bacterium TAE3-ERU29]
MEAIKEKTEFKVGDKVLISPDLTHKSDWVLGTVIDVEQNPFAGIVITAETEDDKDIFFEKEYLFKKVKQ